MHYPRARCSNAEARCCSSLVPELAEHARRGLLGRRQHVADDARPGLGQDDDREAGVVGVRLAPDQAPALERRQLAGDAGGRDAEPLGEVEAPEARVRCGVELEQQREIVESEAVMALERRIDVAHDDRARVGELEDGREGGSRIGGSHSTQHIID